MKKSIDRLMQPLRDEVNNTTPDEQAGMDDSKHRHTVDWPEAMIEEGLPIRA